MELMFYSALQLPVCKQIIHLKQMTSSMFIQLQKYIIENDDEVIEKFLISIIDECIQEKNIAKSFNCIDKLACLIKIRSISCGDAVVFTNQQNVQAQMSMQQLLDSMNNINFNISKVVDYVEYMHITIGLPRTMFLTDVASIIQNCIHNITINNRTLEFNSIANAEIAEITDNLDVSIIGFINKFINDNANLIITAFKGNESLQLNDIIISPFNNSMLDFCKFILKDDLMNLYKNVYTLASKSHLAPEFLMSIAPIEQQIYIRLLIDEVEQTNKQLSEKQNGVNMPSYG